MKKHLLTAAAIATLSAGAAIADTGDVADDMNIGGLVETLAVSDFIGQSIYVVDQDVQWFDFGDGWDAVGEISDLMLNANGEVESVNVTFGDLVGLGGETVEMQLSQFNFLTEENSSEEAEEDYFVVITPDTYESLNIEG